MPYVGNPLADAYSARQKQDLTGQSGTTFTLTHSISSPNDLSVYINHVRQEPTTAYTVNGTALTTTGSVAASDDFYIIYDELAIQSISHPTNQALTATAGTFTSGLVGTTGTFSGALSGTTGTFSGKILKLNAASKSWHSNFTTIDIGDQQAIGYYDGGGSHYMHNRYYDGAWKATETGAGGILIQSSGGDTIIYTSPSASADAAATVTETMRINSAGNVGIGTASPNVIDGATNTHVDIRSDNSNYAFLQIGVTGTKTSSDVGYLEFLNGNNARLASISGGADGANNDGYLSFATLTGGSYSSKMKIDHDGSVLINQTNSAYASGDANDLIIGSNANAYHGITIVGGSSTGGGAIYFSDSTSGDGRLAGHIYYSHQYNELVFGASDGDTVGRFSGDRNLINHGGFFKQTSTTANGGQFYNGTNITGYNGANFSEFNSSVGNEFICSFKAWASGTDQEGIGIMHAASTNNNNSHFLYCGSGDGQKVSVNGNGHFATAAGTYGSLSDERVKKDIKDASDQWDDIKGLKFKKYKLYNSDQEYMGLVAQEAEKVCPSLVYDETPSVQDIAHNSEFGTLYEEGDEIPDGRKVGDRKEIKSKLKVMKYSILYMKAVKALQEAMARIETLEAKVKVLEEA